MKDQIEELQRTSLSDLDRIDDLKDLEAFRVKWLGRRGALTDVLRGLSDAPPDTRREVGKAANELKGALTEAIQAKKNALALESAQATDQDAADFSLPGRRVPSGYAHIVSQTLDEMVDIFVELGYKVATGPDVETEYYNFDALNTPEDHPARDTHDTFYVKPGIVLRTHTSPVQMRVMESTPPPVAIIVPGRVYRVDFDASHSPNFFQLEGLLVDEGVTFADLKGTLDYFAKKLFGPETKTQFRPHFFPFTEPSAEMDVSCSPCGGKGCRLCKYKGWLEIMGCGMVDPEVFRYAKYDYERYSGFAFGMGIDRIALLRHRIPDIHYLYRNDLRILEQF